jgi:hypothetical protein
MSLSESYVGVAVGAPGQKKQKYKIREQRNTHDFSKSSRLSALQLRPLGICCGIWTMVAKTSPPRYASNAGASMLSISAIS